MAKETEPPPLARTIRRLRVLRGWSQRDLAEASGLDRSRICLYEVGRRRPRSDGLARLASALGVAPRRAREAAPAVRARPVSRPGGRLAAGALARGRGRVPPSEALLRRCLPRGPLSRSSGPRPSSVAGRPGGRRRALGSRSCPTPRRFAVSSSRRPRSTRAGPSASGSARRAPRGRRGRPAPALEPRRACARHRRAGAGRRLLAGAAPGLCLGFRRQRAPGTGRPPLRRGRLRARPHPLAVRPSSAGGLRRVPALLDSSRMPDLESSLRRAQRAWTEALALLDLALLKAPSPERAGRVRLKRAVTLEQMGDVPARPPGPRRGRGAPAGRCRA